MPEGEVEELAGTFPLEFGSRGAGGLRRGSAGPEGVAADKTVQIHRDVHVHVSSEYTMNNTITHS